MACGILPGVSGPTSAWPYLRDDAPVLAFAHRGGALHPEIPGLENTLTAFRHAAELGYRHLETDVHATRDGELLAFHDSVLERVTDQTGVVAHLRLAELRRARIAGLESIPTLDEVLDALGSHVRFNIDIKAPGAVAPLARLVREREVWDRVLVGSFSVRSLREFRRLTEGRVATSAHPLEVAAFRFLPSGRLAHLLTGRRVAALQVPHHRGRLRIATPGLVRRAHAAGVHVHVWTVDDPTEMETLLARGVDGLMTDRTDLLKETLQRHGLWKDHA